ncbi:Autophagy-related protein 22-like protein [Elaphomyces granulatus]
MSEDELLVSSATLPQYPGDDTRPTSKKELAGWYSYGWAAEVFTVCAMGSFLPITLEQMARDQGVLLSDKTTPCTSTWDTSLQSWGSARQFNNLMFILGQAGPGHPHSSQCVIYLLGIEINTASFAMYTFSVSVLVQSLLIISMSGAADHGSYRKRLLIIFAILGSISTMLFLFVQPNIYLFGALLAVIANTCFGASFVLLNSFLPLLVRHHPSISDSLPDDASVPNVGVVCTPPNTYDDPLLSNSDVSSSLIRSNLRFTPRAPTQSSSALQLSTRISSIGIGVGYIGSVALQIFCIAVVVATHQTTFSLRLVLFFVGLWWFLFTIPAALWLRPRPGPPLPLTGSGKQHRSWIGYMAYSWKSLGKTALRARHLKDVLLFLVAWFLLSDGIATVSGTAVLFAKTQLDMEPAALGLISVISTVSGVLGAFSWSYLSRLLNLRPSQTIIACICLFELIPLYGLLGFIPAVKTLGFFGLQKSWEMFPLSAVYGLVMGGLSSYCRSFYAELIPPGYETAFYALYAITDKGSSIFGPAIVGAITDRYGEIRPAFVFLAFLIFSPLPLMLLVDVDRGRLDAVQLAAALEGVAEGDEIRSPAVDAEDSESEEHVQTDGRI